MMTSEFISGGYFTIRPAKRPAYLSPLVPETFVTLSSCLTDVGPDLWAVNWENYTEQERSEEAAKFGIPSSVISQLVEWTTPRLQFPVGFSKLADAQEFCARFHCSDETTVVGIGLHNSLITSFRSQLRKEANRGLGLLERIDRQDSLVSGGVTLGYEPLGFSAMHFHSWLCNFSPEEIDEKLGVRINQDGLLSSLADGIRTTDLVREGGEIAIWEPWLVVRYK